VVGLDSFTDYYARMAKERNLAAAPCPPAVHVCIGRIWPRMTSGGGRRCGGRVPLRRKPGVREAMMQFEQYWHENVIATQRLLAGGQGRS